MAGIDFKRYKRIMAEFLDLDPLNKPDSDAEIWCLGRRYSISDGSSPTSRNVSQQVEDRNGSHPSAAAKTAESVGKVDSPASEDSYIVEHPEDSYTWPTDFLSDCESKFWMTYRSNFPPISRTSEASMTLSVRLRNLTEKHGFTSDTGWGCMIRSGQCLLANALSILRLGRDFRTGQDLLGEAEILTLFADDPNTPFSIHRFVQYGAAACGKYPGEWFGPSATAQCIQALTHEYEPSKLLVYTNNDGADVYADKFLDLACSRGSTFLPTLILLGTRLGIDQVNPAYWDSVKILLQLPQSIGIAGGRPSSSHYFFAHQANELFYLDPHFTRAALPLHARPISYTLEEINSCHTKKLRGLSLEDMDPSMLIAFLIKDRNDWERWRSTISSISGKSIVHIHDVEPNLDYSVNEIRDTLDQDNGLDGYDVEDDFAEVL